MQNVESGQQAVSTSVADMAKGAFSQDPPAASLNDTVPTIFVICAVPFSEPLTRPGPFNSLHNQAQ